MLLRVEQCRQYLVKVCCPGLEKCARIVPSEMLEILYIFMTEAFPRRALNDR